MAARQANVKHKWYTISMNSADPATEETKATLENNIAWYLADKLTDMSAIIATKKYLTNDNILVYLTQCNVAEQAVPRVKVQVFRRVNGGVQETCYQLFNDHRLEKYDNAMIFGADDSKSVEDAKRSEVSEAELKELLELIASLQNARQTL
jgi:hypothetical protein